ncbi:hypothetical protein BC937DRAFT_92197 [Endogone sp. FLAS-F59071]|nr:hypothetical protein BC937DRAFT_92197 [Endogone sp. FLAS-F59071]|eukprot:RUS15634.1 hypothetical protein BC937DRAFT_92197 [Endogone sp. FLAS-F59071]
MLEMTQVNRCSGQSIGDHSIDFLMLALDQYATGYTLRFPRYVKTREDKEWDDCMTATELMDLRRLAAGRLTSRKMTEKDLRSPIPSCQASWALTRVKCRKCRNSVIVGDDKHNKNELEVMIKSHGGNYYQDESAVENIHVVAGQMKIRVRGLINRGTRDIIKPQWIFDCVENQDVIPLQPKYMLFTTDNTKEMFRKTIDRWGDSYTDELTDAGFREVCKLLEMLPMNQCVPQRLTGYISKSTQVLAQMDPKPLDPPEKRRRLGDEILFKYFEHEGLPGNLFHRVVAYLDYSPPESKDAAAEPKMDTAWALRKACGNRLDQVALLLRFHGARIVNDPALEGVTHVVMETKDLSRLATLRELYQSRSQLPHIVTTYWVLDSLEENVILEERIYEPRARSFTA